MYELSVAQELYCKSRERADEVGARELESVRVNVGELSGANPRLLRSAWKFVTSETADDQCRLEIVIVPGRQICPQCGAAPAPGSHLIYCERCKCHMRVESGATVDLLEIQFAQELALA